MAFERQPVLVLARDAPLLGRNLRVLTHTEATRAIDDPGDVDAQVPRREGDKMG